MATVRIRLKVRAEEQRHSSKAGSVNREFRSWCEHATISLIIYLRDIISVAVKFHPGDKDKKEVRLRNGINEAHEVFFGAIITWRRDTFCDTQSSGGSEF